MIIKNSELKEYVIGAVCFEEQEGIIPYRFATEKIAAIQNNELRVLRHKTGSGIKIDFFTNSKSLSFNFRLHTPCKDILYNFYYFDVYFDNTLILHQGEKDVKEGTVGAINLKLEQGYKRLTIYLPCSALIEIFDFSLSDGATITNVEYDKNILFLGDSITHGAYLEYPSKSYSNILARKKNYSLINQGIGGDVFSAENLTHMPKKDIDTIVVAYGTNDWAINSEARPTYIEEYYKTLREIYKNTEIIGVLPTWRKDMNDHPDYVLSFSEIREIIKVTGEKYGAKIVDGINFVPSNEEFWWDGYLHPNEKGFELYAEALEKSI